MASQLVLNKRGCSLSVRNGRFLVRAEEHEQAIPFHHLSTICMHPATKLSHEVIMAAIENNIDLLFFDSKGFPVGRVWSNRFGSISTIRKNQLSFAKSPKSIDWVRSVLLRKSDNQLMLIKLLVNLRPQSFNLANEALEKIERYKKKIKYLPLTDKHEMYSSFRGYEGAMSRAYFEFISQVLPEKYRFKRRSQHPARDMFNCLLNYAYGMLYGQVESALIKAGIDPFLGVMHRDEYNRPVLTYDVIEQYRSWGDYVVCHLCCQEVIYSEFFEVKDENYWLNHAGKRILITAMNDYLQEIISMNNLSRSRQVHLDLEAQQFASLLKRFVE